MIVTLCREREENVQEAAEGGTGERGSSSNGHGGREEESAASLGQQGERQGNDDDDEAVDEEAGDYLDPSLLSEATLPISNISRLMKKALPRQAKVSSSAKDLIQACCIEFISFLTSEANDKCLLEKRKTINGDDILFAMKVLGFDEHEVVCRIWLSRYRMVGLRCRIVYVRNDRTFAHHLTLSLLFCQQQALEMANRLKDKEKEKEGAPSGRAHSTSKRALSTASADGMDAE